MKERKISLRFGALVWAASGKDGGLTPQMILEWTRRQAFYTPEQVRKVQVSTPLDLVQMRRDWMGMAAEAEELLDKLPRSERGCLYLNSEGNPSTRTQHHRSLRNSSVTTAASKAPGHEFWNDE